MTEQRRGICPRCGADVAVALQPCGTCGDHPQGEGRAVAWLFSAHWLAPEELEQAAARVRRGDRPDPPRALLAQARAAVVSEPLPSIAQDLPLSAVWLGGLALGSLLVGPLLALSAWFGLREERPRAAKQSLVVAGLSLAVEGLLALIFFLR